MSSISRYALVQCLSHEFRFRRSRSRNLQPKLLKQTPHQGISTILGYQLIPGGIGAIDFTYNNYNWIVRGQADYGYLSDAKHAPTN